MSQKRCSHCLKSFSASQNGRHCSLPKLTNHTKILHYRTIIPAIPEHKPITAATRHQIHTPFPAQKTHRCLHAPRIEHHMTTPDETTHNTGADLRQVLQHTHDTEQLAVGHRPQKLRHSYVRSRGPHDKTRPDKACCERTLKKQTRRARTPVRPPTHRARISHRPTGGQTRCSRADFAWHHSPPEFLAAR